MALQSRHRVQWIVEWTGGKESFGQALQKIVHALQSKQRAVESVKAHGHRNIVLT